MAAGEADVSLDLLVRACTRGRPRATCMTATKEIARRHGQSPEWVHFWHAPTRAEIEQAEAAERAGAKP